MRFSSSSVFFASLLSVLFYMLQRGTPSSPDVALGGVPISMRDASDPGGNSSTPATSGGGDGNGATNNSTTGNPSAGGGGGDTTAAGGTNNGTTTTSGSSSSSNTAVNNAAGGGGVTTNSTDGGAAAGNSTAATSSSSGAANTAAATGIGLLTSGNISSATSASGQAARMFAGGYFSGCNLGAACEVSMVVVGPPVVAVAYSLPWTCNTISIPAIGPINDMVCDKVTLAGGVVAGDASTLGTVMYPTGWYAIAPGPITVAARKSDNTADVIAGSFGTVASVNAATGATSAEGNDLSPPGCVMGLIADKSSNPQTAGTERIVAAGCFTSDSAGTTMHNVAILNQGSWVSAPRLVGLSNPIAVAYDSSADEVLVATSSSLYFLSLSGFKADGTGAIWSTYDNSALTGTIVDVTHSSTMGYVIVGTNLCVATSSALPLCGSGPFAFSTSTKIWSAFGAIQWLGNITSIHMHANVALIGGSFYGSDSVLHNMAVFDDNANWIAMPTDSNFVVTTVRLCSSA